MGLLDEKATLIAGQDPGDASAEGIAKLLTDSNLFTKAVEEGIISPTSTRVVPELRSIIADPELTDPSLDVSSLRTTTPTRQEVLADVPEFSGLEFDPTQQSYIEDLYALYSGALPTRDVAMGDTAQVPGAIDTLVSPGDMDQATSDSILDTTPTITQPTITQPAGGGADMGTVPATGDDSITIENIAQNQTPYDIPMDLSDPGASLENIIAQQNLTVKPAPKIASQLATKGPTTIEGGLIPGDILGVNPVDEVALTGAQTDSLNALAKVSNSIADFGKNVQDTLGGVFDSVNNTIDVFGQKFNVAKTATGLALNAAFGAPVSLAFSLADQLSEAIPQSSQTVADVLTSTYGVDDQGRVQGNPATNVFAGMNAISMFGDPIQAAQERIDNVVDPAKKAAFQAQLNEVVNKSFVTEDELIDDPVTTQDLKQELQQEANVEADLPTSPVETFTGPTIAEVTDGPASDDDPADVSPGIAEEMSEVSLEARPGRDGGDDAPTGPPEGPGATADDGFAGDGPSNAGGPPSGPGATADDGFSGDGPSNAGGPPSGPGESSADAPGPSGPSGGGGSGGGGGKIVCTMMNESYGFGSFRNKIWLKHSKDLAPEYQIGYHKIFLPLVKISKTNKVIRKMLEHIAVHRTIDIRQESRGKVHLLGRVYRKILEPICYWVGKYAKR